MTLIDKAEALRIVEEYEVLHDQIAALPARGVGVQWQNINTAPRGGEWFIARTEHGTTRVVHFADEYDRFPISHDGVVWPTAPTEWMSLKPILAALAPTDAAQAPFRIEDMTLADLMRDPLYEEATTPATDTAQAREAALHDRITEALVAAQERAHRAYEQDAPFDPNEHKVRISVKDTYTILAMIGERA